MEAPKEIYLSVIPWIPGDRPGGIYEEWSGLPIGGADNMKYVREDVATLTWQDIAAIDAILSKTLTEKCPGNDKEYFQEVLRRFNEQMGK